MHYWILGVLIVLGFAGPAFAQETDAIGGLVKALGLGPTATMITVVALACLRAVAATISTHVPDEKLGFAAKIVNLVGGNSKHAKNG